MPAKSTAPAKAQSAAEQTAQTFDWAALPKAEVPEYTRSTALPKDVEQTTPQPIKDKVLESFNAYEGPIPAGTVDAAGKPIPERKSAKLSWRVQECGTVERAKEFQRLAKRYALGHDPRMTLRSAITASTVTSAETVVRFMAKPFEAKDKDAKA